MMPEDVQIRLVSVEFLRPGPPHNQLLSPLTQYLAVCGDAGAGVVTVPYEHGRFDRILKELRYDGDPEDRQAVLHDLGVEIGRLLGGVPGLPGALTNDLSQPGTLVHLRLTLSASELALLPFELAKVPVTASVAGEGWLSLQTRPPVCVTRNIRTVSPEGVLWPDRPRILFIAGDPKDVPYKEHRAVLKQAIRRFRYPARDEKELDPDRKREQYGDLLTILIHPTLAEVFQECEEHRYTHIHILTHGDDLSNGMYGLVLKGPDGAPDVVSGDRFRTAITTVGHRPSVVTVASCDSANVGSIIVPGASFAHELHQAGIPLVIAAQFPLSIEGSIPLTARLYNGLLWGEHPLTLLQRARAELHSRYTVNWHDWASLVVYEALPHRLGDQLDALKYFQTKRAMNSALERIDNAIKPANRGGTSLKDLDQAVEYALERLPLKGQYGVECVGLRASSRKRVAQAAFTLLEEPDPQLRDPYDLLEEARLDYDRAVRGLMVNDSRTLQRLATLHWVLVQGASLAMILGKKCDEGTWEAAKLSAHRYHDHPDPEQRAWAQASLAELWLIRLGEKELDPAERVKLHNLAVQHAEKLGRFYPGEDEFPVKSTRRQFQRYMDWWGHEKFEQALAERGVRRLVSWDGPHGVIETARRLVAILQRKPANGDRKPAPEVPTGGASGNGVTPSAESSGSPSGAGASSQSAKPRSLSKGVASPKAALRREAPFFDIELLPAGHGDSLWIEYGDATKTHRWLIDCGTQQTARHLLQRVDDLPPSERFLELFVMSHIDSDHIGGALPFLKALAHGLRFGDIWFNGWRQLSGRLGAKQGEMFSTALQDLELPWNVWREGGPVVVEGGELPVYVLPGGMTLTLLSPTPEKLTALAPVWSREMKRYGLTPGSRVDYRKFLRGTPSTSTDVAELADEDSGEDNGAPNGTSIALLAEHGGAGALLAADAHAPVLVRSIKALLAKRGGDRLKIDAFKVSHHASQFNVSSELVQLLDCPRYLVSTNGDHFCHPDRQAIARLIKYGRHDGSRPALHFNYKSRYNEVWADPSLQDRYGYSAFYPADDRPGATVPLLSAP
jgi:beta-lactamase superfamily II metal-dependent hydrolase